MSDNELDSLFKEAAEGFMAPQEPSAWAAMAKKLDKAPGGSAFWNWKSISSTAVVGVSTVAMLWYYSSGDQQSLSKNAIDKTKQESSAELPAGSVQSRSADKSGSNDELKSANNTITASSQPQADQSVDPASQSLKIQSESESETKSPKAVSRNEQDKNSSRKQAAAKDLDPTVLENEKDRTAGSTNPAAEKNTQLNNTSMKAEIVVGASGAVNSKDVVNSKEVVNSNSGVQEKAGNNTSTDKTNVDNESKLEKENNPTLRNRNKKEIVAQEKVKPDDKDPLKQELIVEKDEKETNAPESVKEEAPRKSAGPSISIKLAFAPDFSSVKFFTPDNPGFNFGGLVGYSFNDRWSVYTGAISSRKIYTSNDIDKAYTNSGGYDYPVEQLEGDCRVLDIPLVVYYTFFPNRSFSLKAGLGISSYLMLNEDYVYHVDNPYGSDVYYQSIANKNNEWFKVLNISMIVEKRLNNKFSLEFEPFLKAPLTGVGEGEVSLVSLGAFLNLRFDIPIQKQGSNDD